jgi:hypothetical protein
MGTDVHAVWQAKKDGKWVDIASKWEQKRHYFLFAWLADVRNGFGFAGVSTHDPIKPIADVAVCRTISRAAKITDSCRGVAGVGARESSLRRP